MYFGYEVISWLCCGYLRCNHQTYDVYCVLSHLVTGYEVGGNTIPPLPNASSEE